MLRALSLALAHKVATRDCGGLSRSSVAKDLIGCQDLGLSSKQLRGIRTEARKLRSISRDHGTDFLLLQSVADKEFSESREGELFTFPSVCCSKTISLKIRDLISLDWRWSFESNCDKRGDLFMFPALARKIVGQALALPRAFCHLKPVVLEAGAAEAPEGSHQIVRRANACAPVQFRSDCQTELLQCLSVQTLNFSWPTS